MQLVFFGSGPVAAESLRLLKQTFEIAAVITKPTTREQMQAAAGESKVYTVSTRQELDALFSKETFPNTIGVLIDFGIIVSQQIIDYFEKGIVNSHFSLLPELRGADPISFAILEGKDTTGVSLMLLVEAMDEGPLLGFGRLKLDDNETTPTLTSRLIELSYKLLTELLPAYVSGSLLTAPQTGEATYTRKLRKEDGILDWSKPAQALEREVRAYLDWPKSRTSFGSIECVVTQSSVITASGNHGKLFIHDKKLAVYCGKNALLIKKLKPAGKKEMDSQSFLAGYKNRLKL